MFVLFLFFFFFFQAEDGIRDLVRSRGLGDVYKRQLLGLSGGIDSALTCVLATHALGNENVKVLLMPSQYSSEGSVVDARDLAEKLGISYEIIAIEDIFKTCLLYTSDAADDLLCVDLGGRRIIKKKKHNKKNTKKKKQQNHTNTPIHTVMMKDI